MEDQGIWEAVEPAAGVVVDMRKDKKVAKKATAKEVWDCLKTRFIEAYRVRNALLQTLKSDFDAMRMQEGETLDHHAGRLIRMSVKYANLRGTLSDAALVKKLFGTVPNRFLSAIVGIEQFCDLDTMLFEEAVGRLKTYEERSRPRAFGTNGNDDAQLLLTQAEWEARQKRSSANPSLTRKGEGSREWRGSEPGWTRTRQRARERHYANRCKASKKKEEAQLTQADDTERALLLVELEEVVSAALERQEWQERQDVVLLNEKQVWPELHGTEHGNEIIDIFYLDNGASNHMTEDNVKFRELDEAITSKVRFNDGSSVQIIAYYISSLRINIVSLGQLTEASDKVFMDKDELEVFVKNPWQLIMKVSRTPNRLYRIKLQIVRPVCLLANLDDPAWLSHAR
ncbi:uncharacterized protein LOC116246777 [Nymphaea colorata]|uniref:uncharacterized protein LOC116246777 n=1 Tax=Nymphaea colorata TaxID=210225 RepID=UPI00129EC9D8|nr:uncharacterized protein LOC116246777 [Nymphaea colorata]